jgi:Helicase HerA, central domain
MTDNNTSNNITNFVDNTSQNISQNFNDVLSDIASENKPDIWQEVGLNPVMLYDPTPKNISIKEQREWQRQKLTCRLVAQKVWDMQDKVLSCIFGLAVAGGVLSTVLAVRDACAADRVSGFYGTRSYTSCSWNPVQWNMNYSSKVFSEQPYTIDAAIKLLFGVTGAVAFARFGIPLLMRSVDASAEKEEAENAMRQVFYRDLSQYYNLPPDMQDDQRKGWIAEDGKPISTHITAGDFKHIEAARVKRRWGLTAWAFGSALVACPTPLLVAALFVNYRGLAKNQSLMQWLTTPKESNFFAEALLTAGAVITYPYSLPAAVVAGSMRLRRWIGKNSLNGTPPAVLRNRELVVGSLVEAGAYSEYGGDVFTKEILAGATHQQLEAASKDTSPLFLLGTASGWCAARGDVYAPSKGTPFMLSLDDLFQHFLIFGGTGSGKTSGLLRPIIEQALDTANLGVLIIDGKAALGAEFDGYKGVTCLTPENYIVPLIAGLSPGALVDTLEAIYTKGLPSGGSIFWTASAKDLMFQGAVLCHYLGGEYWTLSEIAKVSLRKEYRNEIIDLMLEKPGELSEDVTASIEFFREEWDKGTDDKTKPGIEKQVRTFFSEFERYPEIRKWMNAPLDTATMDIVDVLKGAKIAISIPRNKYGDTGRGLLALLKSRFFGGIKDRGERGLLPGETPIMMIIDEAQEIVTDEDVDMLPTARSLKLAVVAATQTMEGLSGLSKWVEVFTNVAVLKKTSDYTYSWFRNKLTQSLSFRRIQHGVDLQHLLNIAAIEPDLMPDGNEWLLNGREITNPYSAHHQVNIQRIIEHAQNRDTGSSAFVDSPVPMNFLSQLLSRSQTAFITTERAGQPRHDLVILNPIYEVEKQVTNMIMKVEE